MAAPRQKTLRMNRIGPPITSTELAIGIEQVAVLALHTRARTFMIKSKSTRRRGSQSPAT